MDENNPGFEGQSVSKGPRKRFKHTLLQRLKGTRE